MTVARRELDRGGSVAPERYLFILHLLGGYRICKVSTTFVHG